MPSVLVGAAWAAEDEDSSRETKGENISLLNMFVSFSSMSSVSVGAAWAAEDEEDPHSITGGQKINHRRRRRMDSVRCGRHVLDHWNLCCKVTFQPTFSSRCRNRSIFVRHLNPLRKTFLRDLFDTFHKLLRRNLFLIDLLVNGQSGLAHGRRRIKDL